MFHILTQNLFTPFKYSCNTLGDFFPILQNNSSGKTREEDDMLEAGTVRVAGSDRWQ